MSKRAITAQRPFKMLVAHVAGSSDPSKGPSGNPNVIRKTFTQQRLVDVSGRGQDVIKNSKTPGRSTQYGVLLESAVAATPVRAQVEVTLASNTFVGRTWLHLGKYELVAGEDFDIELALNDTATNLANLINTLPEFDATVPVAGVFTVSGPSGPLGNITQVGGDGVSSGNFSFSPNEGTMSGAEPYIGAPEIT